jgi:hypothetical protein
MAHLILPVEHSEADLVLAGQIAELIDSAELYVAWTPEHGSCAPSVPAELRSPAHRPRGLFGFLLAVVREVWSALRSEPRQPLVVGGYAYEQPRTGPAA